MSRTLTQKRSLKPLNTITLPPTQISETSVPAKKVLVPIGFGTEEIEAVVMIDVLRRAGADVTVASVEPELEIEASAGTRLIADKFISDCSDETFDLVALPGGMPGSVRLRDCEILQRITSKQAEEKRLYSAICAAPAVTLLPWGLLKKKQMTCHPAFYDKLPHFRAVKSNIQVSGELTTSRGPGTCFEFALALVEQLFGETVAIEIGESLLMKIAKRDDRKEEFNVLEWTVDHNPWVLLPVANGCEAIEVVTLIDILRRAKVNVVIASLEKSLRVLTSRGTKVVADKFIGSAAESIYDVIILTGQTERLQKSKILKKLLKEQESAGRMYGAISSSSELLHIQGLLKDKRVTAHPSTIDNLSNETVKNAGVVIDGKVITSKGVATTMDFGLAIVGKLFGHARARSVAEGLVFKYP